MALTVFKLSLNMDPQTPLDPKPFFSIGSVWPRLRLLHTRTDTQNMPICHWTPQNIIFMLASIFSEKSTNETLRQSRQPFTGMLIDDLFVVLTFAPTLSDHTISQPEDC